MLAQVAHQRQRHPNAGLPNAFGGYDETPEDMAAVLRDLPVRLAQPGRRLLRHHAGAHIAAIANGRRHAPRAFPRLERTA